MGRADSRRRKPDAVRDEGRDCRKSVRVIRRRQARVRRKWEARGWELEDRRDGRFRTDLDFKRALPKPRWGLRMGLSALVLAVLAGLVVAGLRYLPSNPSAEAQARDDANAAVRALRSGDLADLGQHLAANRGERDFAYFFASQTTPRELGDALSSVAGPGGDAPLNADVDPHEYDIDLTDLAGTLALATHGVGNRALSASWSEDFATATTTPEALYGSADDGSNDATKQRADQDLANKQNLLLLLSRGYWSTPFLEAVTSSYWEFDHGKGDDAWPGVDLGAGKYAPAPNGKYLSDGVLALTAALTANPEAAAWAFTEFQSGTKTLEFDGTDHAIGKFTHYLFFEHRFPGGSDDGSVGMTASLTALSSAIDASGGKAEPADAADGRPIADSLLLQELAKSQGSSGCSWNPLDYGHCAKAVLDALLHFVQRWGHSVLNILSLATFAPPPFSVVGVGAAATNATWYAIDGDYADAGLSLAAAVPGLVFTKVAKGVKDGVAAEKVAAEADDVAKAAREFRAAAGAKSTTSRLVTVDDLKTRPSLWASTKAKIQDEAPKTVDGDFVDPNTGKILPRDETFHYGHKPGYEWRCRKAKALVEGWTLQQLIDDFNDPTHYQIEDPASNQSHQYESDVCAA